MGLRWQDWPGSVLATLQRGCVIPAHPLALDENRALDPRRQRALARYYLAAGAGGLAVGVHTTQFAIRAAGLYEPVLRIAAEEAAARGEIPPAPDLSAPTHAPYRRKFERLVELAKAGDAAGLRAVAMNPISTTPKAMARWRDLAVRAIETREAGR